MNGGLNTLRNLRASVAVMAAVFAIGLTMNPARADDDDDEGYVPPPYVYAVPSYPSYVYAAPPVYAPPPVVVYPPPPPAVVYAPAPPVVYTAPHPVPPMYAPPASSARLNFVFPLGGR